MLINIMLQSPRLLNLKTCSERNKRQAKDVLLVEEIKREEDKDKV